jgi:hypothetical protein
VGEPGDRQFDDRGGKFLAGLTFAYRFIDICKPYLKLDNTVAKVATERGKDKGPNTDIVLCSF